MSQYIGVVAATVTPTQSDGSINLDAIPNYVDHLTNTGVKAVFVNGSTGEWCSFTVEERKALGEQWMKYGRGKLEKIMIHCGALSIEDSKALAKHAEDCEADAIGCLSPSFFKPYNVEFLVNYLSEVASAAPSLPFLYYHIPGLTNVQVDMQLFLSLAHKKIPTFSGIKFSSPNFSDLYHCMEFKDRELSIYYGVDEQLLPALVMGVKGAVGSFYNFLGKQYQEILEDYQSNNLNRARDRQVKISMDIIPLYKKYGNGVSKVLTSLISGIEMGPARLPMKNIFSIEEIKEIKNHLENSGYL